MASLKFAPLHSARTRKRREAFAPEDRVAGKLQLLLVCDVMLG